MKLLPLLLGLAVLPSALSAQGLPIDFDVDAVVAERAQHEAAVAAKDDAGAGPRSVRLGDRRPLQADETPAPALPSKPAQPEG
jgi:hypothetical protein